MVRSAAVAAAMARAEALSVTVKVRGSETPVARGLVVAPATLFFQTKKPV